MNSLPLIMDLADQGVFPYVNGNKVVLTPTVKVTDILRHQVRSNKRPLMADLVTLQKLAGPDWAAFEAYPAMLKTFADLVMISELRDQGIVPDHYTAIVHCETCNQDVPHFPVGVNAVHACVWCLNGQKVRDAR